MNKGPVKIKYIKSKDLRSTLFNTLISTKFPQFLTEKNPDIILVSGGDGAMLHAIQKYYKYQVPFFGYAAGTYNFLMNNISEPEKVLNKIITNHPLHYLSTNSIAIKIASFDNKKITLGYAVNEVVIGSDIMGYHGFCLSSANNSFDNFEVKGTGICISTDLGSTGYNFNLGGPVLPLGCDLWSITGIVCNRYLNDIINSQKITVGCVFPKDDIYVFIDGIKIAKKINKGDTLTLERGKSIKLAFVDQSDFINKRIDITSRYRKS